MRVAIRNLLYPPLGIGGAERSVQYLAEGLVKRGHEVLVISTGTQLRTVREVIRGVTVLRMGAPPGFSPNIYDHESTLRRILRRLTGKLQRNYIAIILRELGAYQPDVVHSNTGGEMVKLWRTLRERGLSTVHTLRNPNLLCTRRMFAEGRSCERQCEGCAGETLARRVASEHLSAVVGISDFILQRHLTHGYFKGVPLRRVIPNSYDAGGSIWRARPPGAALRLGYLGRLHATKGVEEVMAAMAHFPTQGRLVVAGTGNPEYVKFLKRKAGRNVEFVGFVENTAFLEQVDALVVPSTWNEPFGRVYAEAMSHGIPVVGSVFGAGTELVEPGVNGWLCDPTDPASLRAALEQCLGELAARGAGHFRERCLRSAQRFSVAAVAEEYEEVYQAVRERRGGLPRLSAEASG